MGSMKNVWVLLCLMLVLAGCGGGGRAKLAEPPANSPSSGAVVAESARGAPAPVGALDRSEARSAERATAEPPPESRPGLGTEWGESRTSRVHDVTFVRASSTPFAVTMLNYNDRRGVEAMASRDWLQDTRREIDAAGGAVSISLRDADGEPLEAVRVGERTLVVGQAGERYSIVLTNRTGRRFESVVTVDGLDVINGRPGTTENRGYVLLPYATLEIDGFRQSTTAVAAFRFAAVADSYAAQTGSARNVGVIGVALFAERGDAFVSERELRLRETATPFPADPRFARPPRR
jgi:hypothetical protein